jgi:hypothetical protein
MATRVQTLRSKLEISADRINHRPELARHVAAVMAHWSAVELELIRLVLCLLGFEYRSGLVMYAALDGDAAKHAALSALMAAKLPRPMQETWADIWRRLKEPRYGRNALAHWLYATSDDYPDDILLVDPRSEIRWGLFQSALIRSKRTPPPEHKMMMLMLRKREAYR